MGRRIYPPLSPTQRKWLRSRLDAGFLSAKEVAHAASRTERSANSVLNGNAGFSAVWQAAFPPVRGAPPADLLREITSLDVTDPASSKAESPSAPCRAFARRILVELNTRTLVVPVDCDHDDLREVYNSWHEFFRTTRGLLHDLAGVPDDHSRALEAEVQAILNDVMRPHLRRWQSRLRHWLAENAEAPKLRRREPQQRQQLFPQFAKLRLDLERTQTLLAERALQVRSRFT